VIHGSFSKTTAAGNERRSKAHASRIGLQPQPVDPKEAPTSTLECR
jgi:hypothetical protein